MNFKHLFLFLLFISTVNTLSAQIDYSGSINLEGYYSSKEKLPFWFYSNQRGRLSEETNVDGWINGKLNYNISANTSIEIGGGVLYQDAFKDEIFIDELYADFKYKWLQVIAGRKQKEELYKGLSSTNKNFAWSLNARPLPGIQIQTSEPVFFNTRKKLGFEFSWSEFLLGEDRFVKNARLHDKSIYLIWNASSDFQLKGGINHSVIWGGESPVFGEQPQGFKDYLRVVASREGGGNAVKGDQVNVLGSHLGVYELYLTRRLSEGKLQFIYNHFFEDGSGSRFENFPDGRYGVFYSNGTKDDWFNSIIYEFYYTRNQSQTIPHIYDYYFNNGVYASGWTYQNRVIGLPLFTTNYYEDYPLGTQSIRVGNNNIIAHHFGFTGNLFKNIPYKLLMTYRKNYGHYKNVGVDSFEYYPADDPRGLVRLEKYILSSKLNLSIPNKYLDLRLSLGGDVSKEGTNAAAGISLSKQF